jgi:murein DD-endopeptidase MepM/ murein hydrolase activator NlpD
LSRTTQSNPYSHLGTPNEIAGAFLPEFRDKSVAFVDLDQAARRVFSANKSPYTDPSRLAEAKDCDSFVQEVHAKHGVSASFGGYLEDRAFLWQGTYLGGSEKTLHLGIDFNVPSGSLVITPLAGRAIRIDNDHPERWGWGPRVFLEIETQEVQRPVLIFAHLAEVSVQVGDNLSIGTRIGAVGAPPDNGDWFAHLHVQQVRRDVYDTYLQTDIWQLDGYGARTAVDQLRRDFPDPILTAFSENGLVQRTLKP